MYYSVCLTEEPVLLIQSSVIHSNNKRLPGLGYPQQSPVLMSKQGIADVELRVHTL